jgi:pimeloyl-ACP methyl ester carboxylesterase
MPEWKSGDVIANGIRVHYYRTGAGDRPPVVLCHGVTDYGLCWAPVARRLEAEYDVVMLDARGHGHSETVPGDYAVQSLAADVIGAMRALALDRPVIGGHSMGGATATFVAAMLGEEARGAILEDPAWFPPFSLEEAAEERDGFRRMIDAWAGKTRDELLALGGAESPAWSDEELGPWAESKRLCTPNVAQVDVTGGVAWQSMTAQIRCPALLIVADHERGAILTPEMAAEARGLCPTLQVVHVAGAGHNIRREGMAAYMAAVESFLGRLPR